MTQALNWYKDAKHKKRSAEQTKLVTLKAEIATLKRQQTRSEPKDASLHQAHQYPIPPLPRTCPDWSDHGPALPCPLCMVAPSQTRGSEKKGFTTILKEHVITGSSHLLKMMQGPLLRRLSTQTSSLIY